MSKILIIVLLVILVLGGGAFWFFSGKQSLSIPVISDKKAAKEPCTLIPKPKEFKADPYYGGPLIDSHVHLPVSSKIISTVAKQAGFEDMPAIDDNGLTLDYLVCLFESEGIKQTIGFYTMPNIGYSIDPIKDLERKSPGKIVPFFMPPPIQQLMMNPQTTKNILDKNKGLFKGYGEVGFYMESFEDVSPDDPKFQEIYKTSDEHNLVVMIHPSENQRETTEKVLGDYPQVTFFIHGGEENLDWVMTLMKKYNNFYYSLDANLTSLFGFKKEHQFKKPTKEEWLIHIRANFNSQLDRALKGWKDKIEAYPDRFTWGTDRWYSWTFDAEVGGLLEEFGRAFIGRLDPAVQENFAYKNAEEMLKKH